MTVYELGPATAPPRPTPAPPTAPDGPPHLVLLHHAGGSTRGYGLLTSHLPEGRRALGVDLPGRLLDRGGARCRTVEEAVALVHRELGAELDAPAVVFGHSMGALIAYELVRRLEAEGRGPARLVVSGSLAPHARGAVPAPEVLRHAVEPLAAGLPEALVARVTATVRADLELAAGYAHTPGPPLRTPLTVLGGADDPLVPEDRLGDWSAYAGEPVRYHVWPGGHFFLFDHAEAVCGVLARV